MPYLKERTFLVADRTRAVPADSPDASYLLGGAGDEISEEDAKRYGAKTTAEPGVEQEAGAEIPPGADARGGKARA